MYCTGIRSICSNCGRQPSEHQFNEMVLANKGATVVVSVGGACDITEATGEAKKCLNLGIGQLLDISDGSLDNSMTCFVNNITFEKLRIE